MTKTVGDKKIIWLLAMVPLIAGIGQLALQQSSLTLLIVNGSRAQARQPARPVANPDLVREMYGDLLCSNTLTAMCLLWAAFAYRVLSKRVARADKAQATQRPVMLN
jgi:hypothetical protein